MSLTRHCFDVKLLTCNYAITAYYIAGGFVQPVFSLTGNFAL
jgi:hypothetical protein